MGGSLVTNYIPGTEEREKMGIFSSPLSSAGNPDRQNQIGVCWHEKAGGGYLRVEPLRSLENRFEFLRLVLSWK